MGNKNESNKYNRLMDIDSGLLVIRGKVGRGEIDRGKEGQIYDNGKKI